MTTTWPRGTPSYSRLRARCRFNSKFVAAIPGGERKSWLSERLLFGTGMPGGERKPS